MQQYVCVSDSVPVWRPLCRSHTGTWCSSLSDAINLQHVCVCKNVRSGADSTGKNRTKWLHYERGCSLRPYHRNWCFNSFALPKLLSKFSKFDVCVRACVCVCVCVCVSRCRLWLTFSVGVHFILHPCLYHCVCLRRFGDYPLICICVCLFFIHFPMCVNATLSKHISIFMTSHVPRNMLWAAWRQFDS